jgi:hypothetical protein
MVTNPRRETREWMEAEAAGHADEADRHFRAVSRRLARPDLPAGFAARVMARIAPRRPAADAYSSWWVRSAVAAGVVLVGGGAALVPWHAWPDALLAAFQATALGIGRVLAGGQAWMAGGLALWHGLAEAAAVVGRQLLGPVTLSLLCLNLAVAAGALGALRRLMAVQEN